MVTASLFQGQEYVERYKLEYQREDDERWFTFRNRRNQEVPVSSSAFYLSFWQPMGVKPSSAPKHFPQAESTIWTF